MSNWLIAKRIFNTYLSRYLKEIYRATLFMVIFALASAAQVWLVKPALDEIFVSHNREFLFIIPLFCIVAAIIKSIADYYQSYFIKFVGQNIVNDMQLDLYRHLISADLSFLQKHSSGKLMSKFVNDIVNLKASVSLLLVNLIKDTLTVIALIGMMFYNDASLALIAFIVFPIAVVPIAKMGKKMRSVAHDTQEELANYTARLDENFRNIKVIKSFVAEEDEIQETKTYLRKILQHYVNAIKIESLTSPVMEMLGAVAIAATIFYGGYQVFAGSISTGSFFSFIVAFITAYRPVKNLANLNVVLQGGMASAKRIFSTLDTNQTVEQSKIDKALDIEEAPAIKFKNVYFKHEGTTGTLKNISLTIKPGQFVAIVGASGSGKSTLLDLLLKFYTPSKGTVSINGQDIQKVSTKSLRTSISLVNQEVMLFDKSIKENIKYSNPNATDLEVKKAAVIASADGFINDLKKEYNSQVGQFGSQLSGGQKQRLAIARALLKKSPVLVLDEATASLDQISEQNIKKALMALQFKKTIVMVTHRLTMVKDVDMIFVLKRGEIVESGKHSKLIKQKGEYYKLYNKKHSPNLRTYDTRNH